MENMELYNAARSVPAEALRLIQAGRLKGKSDINPMWRIKKLTELFGPCGFGWWYEIVEKHIVADELTGQKAAFVDILLFCKDKDTGVISHGIPGTGGSMFVEQEKSGKHLSDECFKMALTDAISVAAKAIGVAADVYFEKDSTKYNKDKPEAAARAAAEAEEKQRQYDLVITEVKAMLEMVVDAESANAASQCLKNFPHVLTSEADTAVLWNRRMKELNLFYDRVLRAYTPKA